MWDGGPHGAFIQNHHFVDRKSRIVGSEVLLSFNMRRVKVVVTVCKDHPLSIQVALRVGVGHVNQGPTRVDIPPS